MSSKPINAEEFYKKNAADEQQYVRVYAARPVRPGDEVINNIGGLNIMGTADENGWELSAYHNYHQSNKKYLSTDEFKAETAKADALPLSTEPEALTAEDLAGITPVAKGQRIAIDVGLPIMTEASYDGATIKTSEDGLPTYMSNYQLTTLFNYAGAKKNTHEDLVVTLKDEQPIKGIILKEDTVLDFKEGPYEAKAGSFLYPNPDDVDGYTAMEPGFAQLGLRKYVSPEDLAAASKMSTSAPVKTKGSAKFKPKG